MVISSNIIIPVFTHIPFSPFTVHAIYKDNYGLYYILLYIIIIIY